MLRPLFTASHLWFVKMPDGAGIQSQTVLGR